MKTCSKCGEEKSLEGFGKDKAKKDGHRGVCKACRQTDTKKSARKYRQANSERINLKRRECRADNADAINSASRARRANDPTHAERVRANEREAARRRRADPVKRKKQNEAQLRCYYKNKPAYRAAWAKYKAAKVSQTPSWANEQLIAAYYKEAKRLEELTGIQFHVDHIIPLQGEMVSGLHVESNLQLLPAHENLGKSNSFDPETFAA